MSDDDPSQESADGEDEDGAGVDGVAGDPAVSLGEAAREPGLPHEEGVRGVTLDSAGTGVDEALGESDASPGQSTRNPDAVFQESDASNTGLRDIEASRNFAVSEFVDPTGPDAKIIVVMEFEDGSTKTLGIG